MAVSEVQLQKVYDANDVTPSGILILVSDVHSLKLPLSIAEIPSGNVMACIDLLRLKASFPMAVTVYSMSLFATVAGMMTLSGSASV